MQKTGNSCHFFFQNIFQWFLEDFSSAQISKTFLYWNKPIFQFHCPWISFAAAWQVLLRNHCVTFPRSSRETTALMRTNTPLKLSLIKNDSIVQYDVFIQIKDASHASISYKYHRNKFWLLHLGPSTWAIHLEHQTEFKLMASAVTFWGATQQI